MFFFHSCHLQSLQNNRLPLFFSWDDKKVTEALKKYILFISAKVQQKKFKVHFFWKNLIFVLNFFFAVVVVESLFTRGLAKCMHAPRNRWSVANHMLGFVVIVQMSAFYPGPWLLKLIDSLKLLCYSSFWLEHKLKSMQIQVVLYLQCLLVLLMVWSLAKQKIITNSFLDEITVWSTGQISKQ